MLSGDRRRLANLLPMQVTATGLSSGRTGFLAPCSSAVPLYTLVFTRPAGEQATIAVDFRDEAMALEDARGVLAPDVTSVAVSRGVGDDLEFVGVWDWCEGEPRWTAEE
jgi:hypothetical protein